MQDRRETTASFPFKTLGRAFVGSEVQGVYDAVKAAIKEARLSSYIDTYIIQERGLNEPVVSLWGRVPPPFAGILDMTITQLESKLSKFVASFGYAKTGQTGDGIVTPYTLGLMDRMPERKSAW